MSDIAKNVVGSLISAILIALVFSLWNDYIYKNDQLDGYWRVEYETAESSYQKYIGLKTYYDFVIGQNGNVVKGTGEKVAENLSGKYFEYENGKRTHLDFTGSITYKVFSKNKLDLIYKENGRKRSSSTILNLVITSKDKMVGTYISTIAASKGKVTFTKVK